MNTTQPASTAASERRQRLSGAITAVNAAAEASQQVARPAIRLSEILKAAETATRDLTRLREIDDAELAEWLASPCPTTPRPEPTPALLAAEDFARRADRDARAAKAALEGLERAASEAADRVRQAAMARDEIALMVVRDEAREIGQRLLGMLNEVVIVEASLAALITALEHLADASNTPVAIQSVALGVAADVRQIWREARAAPEALADADAASRFLNRLRSDATAKFN